MNTNKNFLSETKQIINLQKYLYAFFLTITLLFFVLRLNNLISDENTHVFCYIIIISLIWLCSTSLYKQHSILNYVIKSKNIIRPM